LLSDQKEINMTPQSKPVKKEHAEEAKLQEQYIRQVQDKSRTAQEVLSDQQGTHAAEKVPALFVP
jgi:hypothetical protein